MLSVITALQAWMMTTGSHLLDDRRARGDDGQATAEYALVLVGAAAVALLLIAWATKTDKIGKLFDAVADSVAGRVK